MSERQCACPSWDAWRCIEIRYGSNDENSKCQCACHEPERNDNGEDWIDELLMQDREEVSK